MTAARRSSFWVLPPWIATAFGLAMTKVEEGFMESRVFRHQQNCTRSSVIASVARRSSFWALPRWIATAYGLAMTKVEEGFMESRVFRSG